MVSDLKTFAHKGCKIAVQKKVCFRRILPYKQDFFGIGQADIIFSSASGHSFSNILASRAVFENCATK